MMKRSQCGFLRVAARTGLLFSMLTAGMLLTHYLLPAGFAQESPAHATACKTDTGDAKRWADGHPSKLQPNALQKSEGVSTKISYTDATQYPNGPSTRSQARGRSASEVALAQPTVLPTPIVHMVPEVAISHNTSSVAPYLKTVQSTTKGGALLHLLNPQTVFISKTSDLFFGTIVVGSKPGSITVPPIGAAHSQGAVILSPGADQTVAQFEVTIRDIDDSRRSAQLSTVSAPRPPPGEALEPLSVLLPDHILLTRAGDKETMRVDEFRSVIDHYNVSIGATLHVNPNQPRGLYAGTYCITIVRE